MTTRIDGKTERESLCDIDAAINAAMESMEETGTPWSATIADAMHTAAKTVIAEKYRQAKVSK